MDVILDANRILNDPRMEGAEFQILLRYLHRTQSSLVIPQIVKDEVLARYSERIEKQLQNLAKGVSALQGLCFHTQFSTFPTPDLDAEVAALRTVLINPPLIDISEISETRESPKRWQTVSTVSAGDYSAIAVEELVRRAIHRLKPASSRGEEFRDVILWLMTLSYAKDSGREVTLISDDEHFFESGKLHPQLKDELAREGVNVHVCKSSAEFLKADVPGQPINEAWIDKYLKIEPKGIEILLEDAVASYLDLGWRSRSEVTSLGETVSKFRKGTLYRLSPESEYAELEYHGDAKFAIGPYVFTKASPFNPKDYPTEEVSVSADFVVSAWIASGRVGSIGLAKAVIARR